MNKVLRMSIFMIGFLFTSCGFHNGYFHNSTSLSQANFSYVKASISGSASTSKFLGLGGLSRQAILAEAKENMLKENPLKSNQSLANVTIDWKTSFVLIVMTNKCTITADVVEFYAVGEESEVRKSKVNIEEEGLSIEQKNIDNQRFKVGDEVIYKAAINEYNAIITGIEGAIYYVKYENRLGGEKIVKTSKQWIKKIE